MTATLYQQIQQFYDASTGLWEQIWGEHMHHGYYGAEGRQKKDRRQAQIDLIEELLKWAAEGQERMPQNQRVGDTPNPFGAAMPTESLSASAPLRDRAHILDVGCGIGGSSLYLAQKFNAQVTGITLSPVQASRATERAAAAGLSQQTSFQVADALNMPFADETFDWVWSLESGEHMPDKIKFLQECYRVLKPGGTLIFATWCHRPTTPPQGYLKPDELKHLAEIYRVYCLPYTISLPEYEGIAHNLSFQNIRTADWSTAVAPFWDVVIDSAFNPAAIIGLLFSGWTTIQAALSLSLMSQGYQRGLIRYGLLCATKYSGFQVSEV